MIKQAILAGGCFWGMEAKFKHVHGVVNTMVGYTGGHSENPNYREVCRDLTGHAEAIQLDYDDAIISYKELLEAFFSFHDPTLCESNSRSFASQYRSAIFVSNDEERKIADKMIAALNNSGEYECKIITEICDAEVFYPAEEYHQDYYGKHQVILTDECGC